MYLNIEDKLFMRKYYEEAGTIPSRLCKREETESIETELYKKHTHMLEDKEREQTLLSRITRKEVH